MAAAAVIAPTSADVYGSLFTFERAVAAYEAMPIDRRAGMMRACERIVRAYGFVDSVAIDIKHVHFDFPDGTVLVERQDVPGLKAVMKPEPLTSTLTPFSFYFLDGVWIPYEFVADCAEAERRLAAVTGAPAFLEELGAVLRAEGDAAKFIGFHVLHRDFLETIADTVETPGRSDDELVIRAYTPELRSELADENGKEVMWSYSVKGPRMHWCGICSHTNTCTGHAR
jgi:hypothetical protein